MNHSDKTIEYEHCVLCGKETNVPKEQYIGLRKNYVAGAGQMCEECFAQVYSSTEIDEIIDENYFEEQIKKYSYMLNFQEKKGYEMFRRVIDIIFSMLAILPVLLLTFVLSIAIRIESPGSPIFSQVRVGKNGKFIKIHKLRSMYIDAESKGQKWAEKDDPRITKVGRFIRKYRLDEIPQFFDVLTGKMSLIGPRPEIPKLTKKFNEETPGFVTRLLVTPGLSGWAQVNGGYDITPKEKYEKDKEYIENRNIKLYFSIFIKTILTVFTGEGAR